MRITLVCTLTAATAALTGCIGTNDFSDPITETLARTPLMYKADIQQGNVVTQEQINKLEPGMDRRQVRFILGTPMLMDTFHQDRWDYVYTLKPGGEKMERKRISVFFRDDRLIKIEGDLRPGVDPGESEKESLVKVPDYKEKKGFLDSTLKAVGLKDEARRIDDSNTEQGSDVKSTEQTKKSDDTATTTALSETGEAAKENVSEEANKVDSTAETR